MWLWILGGLGVLLVIGAGWVIHDLVKYDTKGD